MRIVVCVKPVPEAESRLRATADGVAPDPDGVKFVLAGYDESAVEQALLLKQAVAGSTVDALALGPAARAEEVLRGAIALGCDRATALDRDGPMLSDPLATARGLAEGIAGVGGFDLLLFGKQAGDDEEGLVGSAVAELLGVPFLGGALDVRPEPSGDRLRLRRAVEQGEESWEVPLPCAVGLQQAWNDPRTASLPAILRSRKASIAHRAVAGAPAPGPASAPARFALPPPRQGAKMIEYRTPAEAAERLVRLLREEAKVFP